MRILIGCEFSGRVRDAFITKGHDAWSCDLLPGEGNHYQEDVFKVIERESWDLAIFHPPCTHLASSGAAWFKNKAKEQEEALEFVRRLLECKIPKIALENPVGVISTRIRKPDQIIQPYWFGDPYSKKTCLWLKGLPKLVPTNIVEPLTVTGKDGKVYSKFHYDTFMLPKHLRGKVRSITFQGIADAMGDQWG